MLSVPNLAGIESIIEEVPVVQVVLVAEIHQAENHFFPAAHTGIQKTIQVGGINAKFSSEPIVISAALSSHQFHHFLSAQTGLHTIHLSSGKSSGYLRIDLHG